MANEINFYQPPAGGNTKLIFPPEASQTLGKTVGRWLEEAIQEKLERDGGRDG